MGPLGHRTFLFLLLLVDGYTDYRQSFRNAFPLNMNGCTLKIINYKKSNFVHVQYLWYGFRPYYLTTVSDSSLQKLHCIKMHTWVFFEKHLNFSSHSNGS